MSAPGINITATIKPRRAPTRRAHFSKGNELTKGHEQDKGGHRSPATNQAKPRRVSIPDASLSQSERVILRSLRLFCLSYATPGCLTWEKALDICNSSFGPIYGPQLGFATMNAMRALRTTRTTCFKFTNPDCPCCRDTLAEHEFQFMSLLRAERSGDGLTAQTNALMLCEGAHPHQFLQSIRELAGMLNNLEPKERAGNPASERKRIKFTG